MYPIAQDLGLGLGVKTDLFGYGTSAATATYPGRTFEVTRGTPTTVNWTNALPATHVLPIDPTLLDMTPGHDQGFDGTTFTTGAPAVPHLHGGKTEADSDGTPQQWFTAGGRTGVD